MKPLFGRAIMRDVNEVLKETENKLEQVRREVAALHLALQLVEDSDPAEMPGGSEVSPHDTPAGQVTAVSSRLKRMAASLTDHVFVRSVQPSTARKNGWQEWISRVRDLAAFWEWANGPDEKQLAPILYGTFGSAGTNCNPQDRKISAGSDPF